MKLRYLLILCVSLCTVTGLLSWRSGWNAHADRIKALAAAKNNKAAKAVFVSEQKGVKAASEGKVIYRTINREVVKYVQSPNRNVCKFDPDAVQLRQRAIDAANSISGFDAEAMQGK